MRSSFLPSVTGPADREIHAMTLLLNSKILLWGVTFHAETAAETLPFGDGVFDSVVSNSTLSG